MPDNPRHIEEFAAAVRRQVNRHRLWTTLIWAVALGAAALVVVGLCYTLQGYAVPVGWIVCVAAVTFASAVVGWALRRFNAERASHYADRFFRLQDSVTSYRHFSAQDRHDGYYALQARQTTERVVDLDPRKISYRIPRRVVTLAVGLVAIAVFLGMRGPSDEVQQRRLQEKLTQEETTAINEELVELVEVLRKSATDAKEEELLDPDKLRRWVDDLKSTRHQKEALRQYARLERKLNQARLALNRRKDEQLLERAAEELKKSPETKSLAEKLQQKKYDKAADQLKQMKPQFKKSPDNKHLEKRRRDLARLKAMSQHLVTAARSSNSAASNSASQSGNGRDGTESGGSELAETIDGLAEAVDELDELLEKACRLKECEAELLGEFQRCQQGVCDQLDELGESLKRLAIYRRADRKLRKLSRACSKCQGGLCSSQGPDAGGKKAGWGSNTARREETDELIDNGQTTQLKGIKGRGPSLVTVETADSGSGVSTRRAKDAQREFERQFESFVQREDVPEQVKQGVKRYFRIIHQDETEPDSREENNE